MKFVYTVLALLALSAAEGKHEENAVEVEWTADLSMLVDYSQPLISKLIVASGLDPLKLPTVKRSFWVTPPFLPTRHKAELKLESGVLKNLSEYRRNGSAIVDYRKKILNFSMGIEFDSLLASYDFSVKVLFAKHHGHVVTTINSTSVQVGLEINLANYTINLTRFQVTAISSIDIKIEGNKLLSWLVEPLTNILVSFFKDDLIRMVENEVGALIQGFFDLINSIHSQEEYSTPLLRGIKYDV